jgi:phosphatidate cytidylyltransferase
MAKKMSNLALRVIVALIGIPLLVALCLVGKIPFLAFVLFVGLISFYELTGMLKNKNTFLNKVTGFPAVLLIILNEYKHFFDYQIFFIALTLILLSTELFRNRSSAISNLGSTLLGILYIGFFSASILGIREFYSDSPFTYYQGGYLILSMFVSIWLCDSGAYFIGSAYGLHKLMPRVSPKKSWEGAVAGFIFALAGMIALKSLAMDFLSMQNAFALGIIIGIFGQVGDLVESMIKRDANVKDSSALIPGHGGIFDRFDSLLFTAPIVYLYLQLIK